MTTPPSTTGHANAAGSGRGGWRFPVGVAIFVLGFCAPLAIPLVVASNLPAAWKTVLSGALALGVPEIMMVVAAAVMGKEGFAELKGRFGRFFRKYGPPELVSRPRYRVGLVMFSLPLVLAFVGPYFGGHLPGYASHRQLWAVVADVVFVASFFVLGGGFWDKLRALFVHSARAVFATSEKDEGDSHE